VRLLQGPDFEEIFRTFEQSAFHLEVEDSYHTPDESEPFQKYLTGDVLRRRGDDRSSDRRAV
jgi:hypothetical protein